MNGFAGVGTSWPIRWKFDANKPAFVAEYRGRLDAELCLFCPGGVRSVGIIIPGIAGLT
jgi:hypothetical protein